MRPVHVSELAASIYHHLGIDATANLRLPLQGTLSLVQADPIQELLG
jgi:hypothetical protein